MQYCAQFFFVLGGGVEEDGFHADGLCALDVFWSVVGEEAFFGEEVEALAEQEVDFGFGLDEVLLGGDDPAIEFAKYGELSYGEVYFGAPVGEAIKGESFAF